MMMEFILGQWKVETLLVYKLLQVQLWLELQPDLSDLTIRTLTPSMAISVVSKANKQTKNENKEQKKPFLPN